MDFFRISVKERTEKQGGGLIAYPNFIVGRSKDLMIRGKNFYAVWNEEAGLWSVDEYDVATIVDAELKKFAADNQDVATVKYFRDFDSGIQTKFRQYMNNIGDNSHQLDEKLTFLSDTVDQNDHVSKRLPYDLTPGDHSAWDEIVGTLYKPDERAKIEWAIGSIISGDSKDNQKFLVLYGPPGKGKGTIINILMKLFVGYYTTFDAKALGSGANQFATGSFATNPLLAIQHDGDLSRIEDNTILNSIVSHEVMKVNEKYVKAYDTRFNAFLVMGTNKPVKITDAQSGLIRRLIDVHPSGETLPPTQYHKLMDRLVQFELGAVAAHCLQVYKKMGKNHYSNYRPLEMMLQTDVFFNFIDFHYDTFHTQNGTSLEQAWKMYKDFVEEGKIKYPLQKNVFRGELSNYFDKFHERFYIDGKQVRSYYEGFKAQPFKTSVDGDVTKYTLVLEETTSLLNHELEDFPAQYAKADGSPMKYWDDSERIINGEKKRPRPSQIVSTTLKDIDPYQEHYVKPPENLIVLDFDLTDENGNKSLERNLEAAAEYPPTYAEVSRSGKAVHNHYWWGGDVEELDRIIKPGIEIKIFTGKSALRRKLTLCNNVPIATINTGLPFKEKKRVLDTGILKSEKALRDLIKRNLRKEIHPGTKSSVDFIKKILDDAYEDGLTFDVSDMEQAITVFANSSTNQPLAALKTVAQMRWKSEEDTAPPAPEPVDERLVFFDIECYPNLFVICWKFEEDDPSPESVTTMINPKPHEVEALFRFKLVGFNVRQYDNHMMWAAAMGFNPAQLYNLSKKIISGFAGAKFGEAYNLSYTDIYDYLSEKMSLKKWQIRLGLEHREMDLDWDSPVPEDRIMDVADYCVNDVVSEEKVHKARQGDWKARLLLADLSGLTPNDTTAQHTAQIIFGNEKNPQREFVYTKLEKEFPGYVFEAGKSTYRDELIGEGGLVRSKPGIWINVALFDVASMHPTSIGQLNLFGDFTPRYMALVEAQLALKNGRYADARGMLDGKLNPYIDDIENLAKTDPAAAKKAAGDLRWALKIAMNIVYGLTSAKFDNRFKDPRNIDNIVAKRGALFMVDLMHYIEEDLKLPVIHIKTDSVKVPNPSPEDVQAIMNFGAKYGYTFEHEATYDKMALFNDAVYVAHYDPIHPVNIEKDHKGWTATGTQFIPEKNPYVFYSLFGGQIGFDDMCETKSVQQGALYLDFGNEGSGYVNEAVENIKLAEKAVKVAEKKGDPDIDTLQNDLVLARVAYADALKKLTHIGKTGRFTPVKEGYGGGQLLRVNDGKHYYANDAKGYLWVDATVAADLPDEAIDLEYFEEKLAKAREEIEKLLPESGFTSVEEFVS